MPEISRFFGLIIRMYAEPNAPHHRPQRLIEAWAELHQDELQQNWDRLQAGQPPQAIDPLT